MQPTGISPFDYWFLAHLSFWFFTGSTAAALKAKFNPSIWFAIAGAMAWEIFERFAEPRWPDAWQHPEGWVNILSDLLTCPIGVGLAFWGFTKWRSK